jgi:hypothetical protein
VPVNSLALVDETLGPIMLNFAPGVNGDQIMVKSITPGSSIAGHIQINSGTSSVIEDPKNPGVSYSLLVNTAEFVGGIANEGYKWQYCSGNQGENGGKWIAVSDYEPGTSGANVNFQEQVVNQPGEHDVDANTAILVYDSNGPVKLRFPVGEHNDEITVKSISSDTISQIEIVLLGGIAVGTPGDEVIESPSNPDRDYDNLDTIAQFPNGVRKQSYTWKFKAGDENGVPGKWVIISAFVKLGDIKGEFMEEGSGKTNSDFASRDEVEELREENQELRTRLDKMEELLSRFDSDLEQCCLSHDQGDAGHSAEGSTGLGDDAAQLEQNQPNPFHENTTIKYYLPNSTELATMAITDMNGMVLKTFTLAGKGYGQLLIGGGSLPSGTYIYTLTVNGEQVDSKRMMLL